LPDRLEILKCSNNQLKSLPDDLPPNIEVLYCSDNKLESLPDDLPPNLETLYCKSNKLKSLPFLPHFLTVLYIDGNPDIECVADNHSQFDELIQYPLCSSDDPGSDGCWWDKNQYYGTVKIYYRYTGDEVERNRDNGKPWMTKMTYDKLCSGLESCSDEVELDFSTKFDTLLSNRKWDWKQFKDKTEVKKIGYWNYRGVRPAEFADRVRIKGLKVEKERKDDGFYYKIDECEDNNRMAESTAYSDSSYESDSEYEEFESEYDGEFEFASEFGNIRMEVYPNPVKDALTLEILGDYDDDQLTYHLYDILGKLLDENTVTGYQTSISMEHLQKAVYLLKVTDQKSEVKTMKIIKE